MKKFAEIQSGRVRAIITGPDNWQPQFSPASGLTAVDITDRPEVVQGWLWDGQAFTAPAETAAPTPTPEEYLAAFRAERGRRLTETDYVCLILQECQSLGRSVPLSVQQLVDYRQALRDLPETKEFDVYNPQWPEIKK